MSTFVAAMDKMSNQTVTENGRPSHMSTGQARVDAFFKMVRGLSREGVAEHVKACLDEAQDPSDLVDAFVMWASTRDVRGGKGERDLARWWLVELAALYPETVRELVPLMAEYGSWRDLTAMLEEADLNPAVREAVLALYVKQLKEDVEAAKPSLAGKWAPREGSTHGATAKELAKAMFPEAKHAKPAYRKALAGINAKLDTVEVKMCANQWSEIKPGAIPAGCLNKKRKALMNLPVKGKGARSEKEDRVACAKNIVEHAIEAAKNPGGKKSMHGRVLHPHEMAKHYMNRQQELDVILEAQWVDLRERIKAEVAVEGIPEGAEETKSSLGKMVPLVDVSGSMHGTPMEVAIALGILISEVAHPAVRDRFITFESEPRWIQLKSEMSLMEKVQKTQAAPWGGSTDLSKALHLLLKACVEGEVPPEEIGDLQLVVLSDMQFNQHNGGYYGQPVTPWDTQYQELVKAFAAAGKKSKYGVAFPVPRVIFWNLRGNTRDYPAEADTPGVDMVSGFSPNLLKLFLAGDLEELFAEMEVSEDESPGKVQVPKKDPMATVRKALDDARYQMVREVCAKVGEGGMKGYTAPMVEEEEVDPAQEDDEFLVV